MFLIFLLCACANESIGYQYLGKKYINSPLGEGYGYDSDPLIRYDAFDCTTFVETTLARGNIEKLSRIRYSDAKHDFLSRNHFIESDWMSHNADLVENVSSLYGQTETRFVKIDKKSWLKKVHNIDAGFPIRYINLEYLPYS
ncbi:MAG: N-acetylmuramoyl-L-alanine amidase-like domain-containing protein, partial [Alphaproteobacteria bacterium]